MKSKNALVLWDLEAFVVTPDQRTMLVDAALVQPCASCAKMRGIDAYHPAGFNESIMYALDVGKVIKQWIRATNHHASNYLPQKADEV